MFQPTDIVIAKVKGYPPWPAMIIPFEIIPQQVLTKNRSKLPDEFDNDSDNAEYIEYSSMLTFKKFTHELTNYCVKFFHDDSYIWLNPKNLHELTLEQTEAFLSKANSKTSKNLVAAYTMAKQGLTSGIDVWEFAEYGSKGKPDDEDYTEGENDAEEEYVEGDPENVKRKPTRSSSRTKTKRAKSIPRRSTRSNTKPSEAPMDADSEDGENNVSEDAEEEEEPVVEQKPKAKSKAKVKAKHLAKTRVKISLPKETPQPIVYHYEDDVDWTTVGLGPQDLDLESSPPFVSKLLTKKNLEIHNDLKMELKDRLNAVNRMLIEYCLDKNEDPELIHLLNDEINICLSLKGKSDELWAVFLSNPELLLNFRILLNLKKRQLEEEGVLDKLLDAYDEIYDHSFQFDSCDWSKDAQIIKEEPTVSNGKSETPIVTESV